MNIRACDDRRHYMAGDYRMTVLLLEMGDRRSVGFLRCFYDRVFITFVKKCAASYS
jgi:hypothetical protein